MYNRIFQCCSASLRPVFIAGGLVCLLCALTSGYFNYSSSTIHSEGDKNDIKLYLRILTSVMLTLMCFLALKTKENDKKPLISAIAIFAFIGLCLSITVLIYIEDPQAIGKEFSLKLEKYEKNETWIDSMQMRLDCCGWKSKVEWSNKNLNLPESCKKPSNGTFVDRENGCQQRVELILLGINISYTIGAVAVLALLSVALANLIKTIHYDEASQSVHA